MTEDPASVHPHRALLLLFVYTRLSSDIPLPPDMLDSIGGGGALYFGGYTCAPPP